MRVSSWSDDHVPSPVEAQIIPLLVPEQPTTSIAPPRPASMPRSHETAPIGGHRMISSTGYCETGRMANGQIAHEGAVSSHVLPRGSRWRVLSGPYAGAVLVVEDTGPLATFDIAMPGRCAQAIDYGRRTIEIEAA
jgi:3D (Asp-Asp-Asp) domain-containing protein